MRNENINFRDKYLNESSKGNDENHKSRLVIILVMVDRTDRSEKDDMRKNVNRRIY